MRFRSLLDLVGDLRFDARLLFVEGLLAASDRGFALRDLTIFRSYCGLVLLARCRDERRC